MAIRGITFSKQSVSSNDDAHIYKVLLGGRNGKTKGCKMTFGIDNIYISEGYFFAANRLIEISSTETITSPIVTTGVTYCRLVFEIDLTKLNTNTEFAQGYFKILSSTTNYPSLTQEDLDEGGSVYQLPFAKFQKSISGIANFVSELEVIRYSNESLYIYVSASSGDDGTGDGSESHPYKTIQKAINDIPYNLNGYNGVILVSGGVYNESIDISDIVHGTVTITNRQSENVVINGNLSVSDCHCVNITGFETLTINGRINIDNVLAFYDGAYNTIVTDTIYAEALAANNSNVTYSGNLSVKTLSYGNGVSAETGAKIYIENLTVLSGTGTGIKADFGGQVAYGTATNYASTQMATARGGRIYSGAQTSVPKY